MKPFNTLIRTIAASTALVSLPSLAQAQAAAAGGGMVQMLIMFGGIGLVMYMFMIRPQQRRAREQREMIESSQSGDYLLLNSGFKVKLKHKDDRFFRVELAEGVTAEVDPSAVTMNTTAMEKAAAKKAGKNRNN